MVRDVKIKTKPKWIHNLGSACIVSPTADLRPEASLRIRLTFKKVMLDKFPKYFSIDFMQHFMCYTPR